jgi:phosphoglycolate phosphatase
LSLEIITPRRGEGSPRHFLFDFDGTLSVIRQGWQDVMIGYFSQVLADVSSGNPEKLLPRVKEWVFELTGKQTIYQAIRLAEEIQRLGGDPQEPLAYKHEYQRRLWEKIESRVRGLETRDIEQDSMLVEGARAFLKDLVERGMKLYLASGTDQDDVEREAGALGLEAFFQDRMYGALDEYWRFSKALVIEQILTENRIEGASLVVLGDGFVEIENCRDVGGLGVGVASDEVKRCGIDEWKRRRLIAAGADVIVGDYLDRQPLLDYIFGS